MSERTPHYFETAKEMRAWLQKNHAMAGELLVGYYKAHAVDAGKRRITWSQSVAEANGTAVANRRSTM